MRKEHFKNMLEKSRKATDKPLTKIIYSPRVIKRRKFTREEFNVVQTKIKSRKAACLYEITLEEWKTRIYTALQNRRCKS